MKKRIAICPGHGGRDNGCIGNNMQEKRLTWDICNKIIEKLNKNFNVETILIQPSMTNPNVDFLQDLYGTINEANRLHKINPIDYYLSIHINATPGGTGFESYVYPSSQGKESDRIRNIIHDQIMQFLKQYSVRDRGKKYSNFAELRQTIMLSGLYENLFIDNVNDAKLLADSNFIDKLANEYAYALSIALELERL